MSICYGFFISVDFYIGIKFAGFIVSVKIKNIIYNLKSGAKMFCIFFRKFAKLFFCTRSGAAHKHRSFYQSTCFKPVNYGKGICVYLFFSGFKIKNLSAYHSSESGQRRQNVNCLQGFFGMFFCVFRFRNYAECVG